jgi:hypothetical protein
MPGGLLQLAATGQANIILNGNPSKTFFKAVYKPYTQFGLQRLRIDYTGERNLLFDSATEFQFKIPRYGDLLWDSYIVLNLPDIWSPLFWSKPNTDVSGVWVPYKFQWTNELGLAMIKEITIHSGGNILSRYSGEYMSNALQRDETTKIDLINKMIGNLPELYDPASRFGFYPNAINNSQTKFNNDVPSPECYKGVCNAKTFVHGIEPSIRGRKLYIPLMAWFCSSPKMALPLVALQYQEVFINVEFRPLKELYTILDVTSPSFLEGNVNQCPTSDTGFDLNSSILTNFEDLADTSTTPEYKGSTIFFQKRKINDRSRKSPDSANPNEQLWKFIQPPPDIREIGPGKNPNDAYENKRMDWNADIHIIGTYIFLNNDERKALAAKEHHILIKTQYEYEYPNSTGSKRIDIPSKDMVSGYMWRFRRSDVHKRNQWHNYQNYPFENVLPIDFVNNTPINIRMVNGNVADDQDLKEGSILAIKNPKYTDNSFYNLYNLKTSNCMSSKYIKNIMTDMGIICGQEYRENTLDEGIYSMIEKWSRTSGGGKDGLYCYNFCIDSNRNTYQPTGAQNTNKWRYVTFEFNTIEPPLNQCQGESNIQYLCDSSGIIIGLRKNLWDMNEYNFDLRVFEERFNMIEIIGGRMGLMLAR